MTIRDKSDAKGLGFFIHNNEMICGSMISFSRSYSNARIIIQRLSRSHTCIDFRNNSLLTAPQLTLSHNTCAVFLDKKGIPFEELRYSLSSVPIFAIA